MNKRVALISGASRGIGKAIALELARRGHSVAVGFHERADAAQVTAEEIQRAGGTAFPVQLDVTDPASCSQVAAAVKERCGSLDILVNNAGITDESPALATDDACVGTGAQGLSDRSIQLIPRLRQIHGHWALGPHHQHFLSGRQPGRARTGELRRRQGRP